MPPTERDSQDRRRVLLGRIGRAHGIRGEVSITTFTAVPGDITAYGPLSDKTGARRLVVKVIREQPKGGVIARVEGVADRTAAEKLNGTELWVERSRLPEPAAGEFYHSDLVGLAACAPDGSRVGKVASVQNYGAGDLLEIELEGRPGSELIPFTDAFVPQVDVAGGRVVVILPRDEGAEAG